MSKIKWTGVVKDPAIYQEGNLAPTAKKLKMPATTEEMMLKSLPFAIPAIVISFGTMLIKAFSARMFIFHPLFLFLGFLLALVVLLPIHELLHAVVFPKDATVHIGIMPKSFAAVALCSYPMRRSRFILMSLLPVVLGIIPFVLLIISPASSREVNSILFFLMIMGFTSPYPDYFNVYQVLKQTKAGCSLQFYKDDLYEIPASTTR